MRRGIFRVSMFCVLCLCVLFVIAYMPYAEAFRTPKIVQGLGAFPISCSIYEHQVALGGVHADDTMTNVIARLGQPPVRDGRKFIYGAKGLNVLFIDWNGDRNYTVVEMVAYTNGVATPDGVRVGMPDTVLSQVYGTADEVSETKNIAPNLSAEVNEKMDRKFHKTVYRYYANECLSMSFEVRGGIIKEIIIHRAD